MTKQVTKGSPYDRGAADSYYGRPGNPHYFIEVNGTRETFDKNQMTQEQLGEYWEGYDDNEKGGYRKDWL